MSVANWLGSTLMLYFICFVIIFFVKHGPRIVLLKKAPHELLLFLHKNGWSKWNSVSMMKIYFLQMYPPLANNKSSFVVKFTESYLFYYYWLPTMRLIKRVINQKFSILYIEPFATKEFFWTFKIVCIPTIVIKKKWQLHFSHPLYLKLMPITWKIVL